MSDDVSSHSVAKAALRGGRFDEALKRYAELAASGSPEAWINLGWMYQHGKGVPSDLVEAERYYRQAFAEYSRLAASGSSDAWNTLGWMHEHGAGVPTDLVEARTCYRNAAALDHVGAQRSLARLPDHPSHVAAYASLKAERFEEALKRYSELAASYSPNAWINLGWMHEHGKGVPTDLAEAEKCYRKAVALGDRSANFRLGSLLVRKGDYQGALPFFAVAAGEGHLASTYWLGRLYLKGQGVDKDVRKAALYLKQAADMGDLRARRDYHWGLLRGTFGERELLSGFAGWLQALFALRSLRWLWMRGIYPAKVIGLAFLVVYFFHHPFRIEGVWVAAAVAIDLGVAAVLTAVFALVVKPFFASQRFDSTDSAVGRKLIALIERRPLRELLLLPGEDGLFFVPLLMVGITPISAALFSVAYAAAHYPTFTVSHCVGKSVLIFAIATFVLPHGIGSVIVGHLLTDSAAFLAGRRLWLLDKQVPVSRDA
jgi:TPR repeat protein